MKSFKEWQKLQNQASQLRTQNREVMRQTSQANRSMTDTELTDFDRRIGEMNDLEFRADTMAAELVVSGSCDWTRDSKGKAAIVERAGGRSSRPAHFRALADGTPDTRRAGMEDIRHGGVHSSESPERMSYRSFLQGGFHSMTDEHRDAYQRMLSTLDQSDVSNSRALSTTNNAGGAFTVPTSILSQIDNNIDFLEGPLQVADVIDTDNGRPYVLPTSDDTSNTGEQTAESATVTDAGDDPVIGAVTLNAYNYDSKIVRVPISLLQDSAADVETFVTSDLQTRIFRKLNPLLTTGSGTNEPQGCITASTLGATSATPTGITRDDLLNLIYSVPRAYRQSRSAAFMFNENTMKAIQKLVDGEQRPLFSIGGALSGLEAGAPDQLLGYRYQLNNAMPDLAAGNKAILFGDWSKYKIRRVNQLVVFRLDQLFMKQLQVGFLAWQRFDARLVDAGSHPLRHLLQHA